MSFKQVGSTNTKCYGLAEQGAPEWTVVVSEVQRRGRGRSGKVWKSSKGGLWFSIVLRPLLMPTEAWLLQILASVAVRAVLAEETREKVLVKWPNDLIVNSKKLGGILVETKTVRDNLVFAVVGIGLNVNQHENFLPSRATSLYAMSKRRVHLGNLLRRTLNSLESRYQDLGDPSRLVSEWWRHCVHRSKKVMIEGPEETIIGLNEAIDNEGRLLVTTETGARFHVGEGTLRVLDA